MRELAILPGNIGTNPRFCRMSRTGKLIYLLCRTATSACGVSMVDPHQFGRVHDFEVREVEQALGEMVKVGLCAHDPDTFELFFLDVFRWEKFRGRGWQILESATRKIESQHIRRLVDQARPARPIDDHPKPDQQPTANRPRVNIPVLN